MRLLSSLVLFLLSSTVFSHRYEIQRSLISEFRSTHGDKLIDFSFSADGNRMAAASTNGQIRIFDGFQRWANTLTLQSSNGAPLTTHFSPDGRFLAYGTSSGVVVVKDASGSNVVKTLTIDGANNAVSQVRFSPSSTFLSVATGQNVYIFDVRNNFALKTKFSDSSIRCAVFSSDDIAIITGASQIFVWNFYHNQVTKIVPAGAIQSCAVMLPGNQAFAILNQPNVLSTYVRSNVGFSPSTKYTMKENAGQSITATLDGAYIYATSVIGDAQPAGLHVIARNNGDSAAKLNAPEQGTAHGILFAQQGPNNVLAMSTYPSGRLYFYQLSVRQTA